MEEKSNAAYEKPDEYALDGDFEENKSLDLKEKLTYFLDSPLWTISIIILVAVIAFSIGWIFKERSEKSPVKILNHQFNTEMNTDVNKEVKEPQKSVEQIAAPILPKNQDINKDEVVVGSKNGTKYHYPTCPGAKQISEKNKITFSSIAEARSSGYTPAANCKGLK